jgi:hypothetical protein
MLVVSISLYDPGPKWHFRTVKIVTKACIKTININWDIKVTNIGFKFYTLIENILLSFQIFYVVKNLKQRKRFNYITCFEFKERLAIFSYFQFILPTKGNTDLSGKRNKGLLLVKT